MCIPKSLHTYIHTLDQNARSNLNYFFDIKTCGQTTQGTKAHCLYGEGNNEVE